MGIWVDELRHQYVDSLKTFDKVLAQCPAELWTQRKGSAAVWHEAYHNLFWLKNFVGRADHKFNPHPFGIDMDPRLFAQPSGMVSQDDAKEYLADAVQYVEQVFAELTDEELSGPDAFGESDFRNVYQRLLYELRHLQHHSAKLIAYLRLEGNEEWFW